MKDKIKVGKVNIHSNIDLITNSSTEIFCKVEGRDLDAVSDVLNSILEDFGCNCLLGESGLEVYEVQEWNEESNSWETVEGVFEISYEYGYKPCKMVMKKLKEMLNVVEENEDE